MIIKVLQYFLCKKVKIKNVWPSRRFSHRTAHIDFGTISWYPLHLHRTCIFNSFKSFFEFLNGSSDFVMYSCGFIIFWHRSMVHMKYPSSLSNCTTTLVPLIVTSVVVLLPLSEARSTWWSASGKERSWPKRKYGVTNGTKHE